MATHGNLTNYITEPDIKEFYISLAILVLIFTGIIFGFFIHKLRQNCRDDNRNPLARVQPGDYDFLREVHFYQNSSAGNWSCHGLVAPFRAVLARASWSSRGSSVSHNRRSSPRSNPLLDPVT